MKAVVYTEYGPPDVLRIEEVEKPTPNENQVLIKVHVASINAGDYRVMRANPFLVRLVTGGLLKPKDTRLGSDVAGRVEAVGENVKQFRPGDEVFGCRHGAFAEYVCAGGTMPQFFQAILLGPLMSRTGGQKLGSMGIANVNQEDLVFLGELLTAGKIVPVIDRSYPLSEIAEAFRYVEDTHAQGKVVITVEPDNPS